MHISQLDEMITEHTYCRRRDRNSRSWINVTRSVIIVVGCALLASCLPLSPSGKPTVPDPNWSQVLNGRFIYKSPEESFSAIFTWKSRGSAYELRLRDRLGLRRIRIEGDGQSADIETPDGQTLKDVNVQTWLDEEFAISVPILELPDCLTMDCSLVRSGKNHLYDEHNRLLEFEYDAWTVQAIYDARTTEDSKVVKEIQMLNVETKVRMIFDN